MTDDQFWAIIAKGCQGDPMEGDWNDGLVAELVKLPPEEMVAFDRLFDEKTDALYTVDHWGAAYLINGGASDDGFYYWQCWVVGLGKEVYEAALANPDSLARVVEPGEEYEAEIYGVGGNAWRVSGGDQESYEAAYLQGGPRNLMLKGPEWDYHDDTEVRTRFPNLANLLLTHGEDE
jgi:hypothetical protein